MHIEAPEPRIDDNPDEGEAAGGVDAVAAAHQIDPVIPEPPISPQIGEEKVPEAIQERDASPQEGAGSDPANDPTAEPSA
ncbi:MAG TPA: hypothetical protein VFO98_00205 [Marmoricola sp.]|jgi:hypothetical protein|nr:hypothetical protein [Marmoricola sp.]